MIRRMVPCSRTIAFACPQPNVMNAAVGSVWNATGVRWCPRTNVDMPAAVQLPTSVRTAFAGGPRRIARCGKPTSFETITNPYAACVHANQPVT